MDKSLALKYSKVLLTETQKKMYLDLLRTNPKALEILKIMKENTASIYNPVPSIGVTKEKLMREGFSKFHVDTTVSLFIGATLIYYENPFQSKGTFYNLTIRGAEIYLLLEREGLL